MKGGKIRKDKDWKLAKSSCTVYSLKQCVCEVACLCVCIQSALVSVILCESACNPLNGKFLWRTHTNTQIQKVSLCAKGFEWFGIITSTL